MQPKKLRLGLIQTINQAGPTDNLAHAEAKLRSAAKEGAQLVVLPELFRSRYFCDTENYEAFDLAEPIPGPSTNHFAPICAELQVALVLPLFERAAPGLFYNALAVIDADGTFLGKYRKMHIPDDPGFYEKFFFTPGDLGFKTFHTHAAKVGTLICWDQWFPEAARLTALQGAELLTYPTAIGWHQSQDHTTNRQQYDAWKTAQRAHAIANGIPVVAVNRTGIEGEVQFWGASFVCDGFGQLLYEASHYEEEIGIVELDLAQTEKFRTHWPFLRDRRTDAYGAISSRGFHPNDSGISQ